MRWWILLSLWAYCASTAWAGAVHVPEDQPTIQAGLDAAASGDSILVAPGVYTGEGNRDLRYHGKTVDLVSTGGPAATVIDVQGTAEDPHNAIETETYTEGGLIEGFTFRNGYALRGGAIHAYRATFTLRNCVFENNYADEGGVISAEQGGPINVYSCRFSDNSAAEGGVFMYLLGPEIVGCDFLSNHATSGGVFYWCDNMYVRDCLFRGNTGAYGAVVLNCNASFDRCIFDNNAGGPMIALQTRHVAIDRSTIVGNGNVFSLAEASGGIENSIVAFNQGSVFYCPPTIPFYPSRPYISNSCVFATSYGCAAEFADSLGNFSFDPMFCDTFRSDFRLDDASPCAVAATDGSPIGAVGVGCTPVAVDDEEEILPNTFSLSQNYPNPFNPTTAIRYSLAYASHVKIIVYDPLGRRVATLVDAAHSPGAYETSWPGTDGAGSKVASGVYFYQLTTETFSDTKKMLLLR